MATLKYINPNRRNIEPGEGLPKNLYVKAGDLEPIIDQINENTTDIASVTTEVADMLDGFLYQGAIDCSLNPNYPAMTQDQYYFVSVAGLIGGGAGTAVETGDMIICLETNTGGTQAAVGFKDMIIQKNMSVATLAQWVTGTNDTNYTTVKLLTDAGYKYATAGGNAAIVAQSAVKLHAGQVTVSDLNGTGVGKLGSVNGQQLQISAGSIGSSSQLNGGRLEIRSEYGTLVGGDINIIAGAGGDTSGGNVQIESGAGGANDLSGFSGDITVLTGQSVGGSTGGINIYTGDANVSGATGNITIVPGTPAGASLPGNVIINNRAASKTYVGTGTSLLELGQPQVDGAQPKRVIRATYDFAVHGGAQGSYVLGTQQLPGTAIVTRVYMEVVTEVSGGVGAQISFGTSADPVAFMLAATGATPFTVGIKDGIQVGTAATMLKADGANRDIVAQIIGNDMTQGKVVLFIEYVVSE